MQPKLTRAILNWFHLHGRKDLPWQLNNNPYRVWISEVMLQQTQVKTVIPFFEKFIDRFPDLATLANAEEEEVLTYWAGLGYYSRARNLRRAAQMIVEQFAGELPNQIDQLISLPGIGRSTAGAILSLGFHQPTAILDGNVKRVLARLYQTTDLKQLWQLAEQLLPQKKQQAAPFTQALMDLGATICTQTQAKCLACPLIKNCLSYQHQTIDLYPQKKAKKIIPKLARYFLLFELDDRYLLIKRPSIGIWGGLWCLPEYDIAPDEFCKKKLTQWCQQHYQLNLASIEFHTTLFHRFTHFELEMRIIKITIKKAQSQCFEANRFCWQRLHEVEKLALPTPIKKIIQGLSVAYNP